MLDTYADSHLTATSSARDQQPVKQRYTTAKYVSIASKHHFVPVAVGTSGVLDNEAEKFLEQVGHRCTEMTGDPNETSYLFNKYR